MLKYTSINQNRNNYNQHILTNKKWVYSYSTEISALGSNKLWEVFSVSYPVTCKSMLPVRCCQDVWRSGGPWMRGQENVVAEVLLDEAGLHRPICSMLECWLCDTWLGMILEKNQACSLDQCQLQVLRLSACVICLVHIPPRCNGFTRVQTAAVEQTAQQRPWSCWLHVCLWGSALEILISPVTELVATSRCMQLTFCNMLYSNREMVRCCCTEERRSIVQYDSSK